jgi:MOSC domain-containing protein YiiM
LGVVVSIHVCEGRAAPMTPAAEAHAVLGRGLEGDRYFRATGTYSSKPGPSREVTLIEMEAIEAARRDYGILLEPNETRRNIVTQGVALNHLVGREFTVGDVHLRGIRLCEPCGHLEGLTRQGVRKALVHRGGLRAQILSSGTIRVGDSIGESLPEKSGEQQGPIVRSGEQ